MKEELYEGREQSLVKHLMLRRYLQRFAFIIGSHWDAITYIDCFSGPWKSRSDDFADTSFGIAIQELRIARDALHQKGKRLDLRCFFLEKSKSAYAQLRQFVDTVKDVEIETRNASLEDSISQIVEFSRRSGKNSFPFVFIDPTGWTGFALNVIRPLLSLNPGEVLINFMTEHIRRFIDSPDLETQESFEQLFGSTGFRESLKGLASNDRDDAAVARYTDTVKKAGGFRFASPAVVLHPEINRSHFHLIYLTRDPKGIEVFKDAERQAMREMEAARAKAQQRARKKRRGGQEELFAAEDMHDPSHFDELRERYIDAARGRVLAELSSRGQISYDELWVDALSFSLVWEADLKEWISGWVKSGELIIDGMAAGQRVPRRGSRNVLRWKNQ